MPKNEYNIICNGFMPIIKYLLYRAETDRIVSQECYNNESN